MKEGGGGQELGYHYSTVAKLLCCVQVLIELEHFPGFETDVEFTRQLVAEQSVFCLPGKAFCATGCMRIVLIMPNEKIVDACKRITEFCNQHYSPQKRSL